MEGSTSRDTMQRHTTDICLYIKIQKLMCACESVCETSVCVGVRERARKKEEKKNTESINILYNITVKARALQP